MSVGLGLLEVVVLLAACVVVIALLRNPKALKWVAIPVGMLVLLGAISIVIALSAPRYRTVVPATEWQSDQPLLAQEPGTPVAPSDVLADADRQRIDQIAANRQAIDRPLITLQRGGDAVVHVRLATWAKLTMIGLAVVAAVGLCVAIPLLCRKWIFRHKEIVFPVAGVLSIGALGLAAVLAAGLFYLRTAVVPAQVRYVPAYESAVLPEPMVVPVTDVPDQFETVADSASAGTDSAPAAEASATADVDTAASDDASADLPAELPGWIRDRATEINNLDHKPLVLASDRWATVQECEAQMESIAAAALAHQLRRHRVELSNWRPKREFVRQSGALRQQFVEQTSLQVGEFESPMYRSYWEVDVTPAVSDLAFAQWKADTVEQRLIAFGAGSAGLTLLFALAAAGLRIDSATNGRYRRRLAFAAVGFCTAVGAAALFMA